MFSKVYDFDFQKYLKTKIIFQIKTLHYADKNNSSTSENNVEKQEAIL